MKTNENINYRFFNRLESALKQYKKYLQNNLQKNEILLTYDQWQVLDIIINNKDVKQTEIARLTSKDTASVTRIIDLLNRKGFVARQIDPDNRRNHLLGVSAQGEKEHNKAEKIIVECLGGALKAIKDNRIKKQMKLFKNIIKNCGQ